MRERINRLAKGIIDMDGPKVKLTPPVIEEVVRSGGIMRRELVVTSENNLHIKGLVYSSNTRVRLQYGAFGGTYNHVVYEVNTGFLEDGDEIKGSFYLVTNGGEREVPYSFRVELGTSGKVLSDLETAADFAEAAMNDYDTALRLFEYRDFTEAPFMKDLHVRALYDGLKGRPNRRKELEEFLTGLGVKRVVKLSIDEMKRHYEDPDGIIEDSVVITRNCWGYVNLEVSSDCAFIEIEKRSVTDQDFLGDQYELKYRVHPGRMHQGRNFGRIMVCGVGEQFVVTISARISGRGKTKVEDAFAKEAYATYLRLRLEEEGGRLDAGELHAQMRSALDDLIEMKGESDAVKLLRAEICIKEGQTSDAALLLDECRDSILAKRQEKLTLYCYYQCLRLELKPDDRQRESLMRLIRKYQDENPYQYALFFLWLRLDERMKANPASLYLLLGRQFLSGCHSPFLYVTACRVLNQIPESMHSIGPFELQALLYGASHGLLGEKLALAAGARILTMKQFHRLHYRMLTRIYQDYPEKEVLEGICSLLIRMECRNPEAFTWYERGVKAGVSLTRLFEYYLYALPKNHLYMLPKEVLLYFSYGENELDRHSRAALYRNVLVYLEPSDPLYQAYEREIEKFATEQLFESRINSRLAVIYEHMIFKDVIDVPMAQVLPSILRSYRVECANRNMKYVVVCYEELTGEDVFLLEDRVAYVPLFSRRSFLLFQDAFGNRYSTVSYKKTAVMDKPDLEARCFELYPEHSMLRLTACDAILERGIEKEQEVKLLEETLGDMDVHPLYERLLLSRIIEYYRKESAISETAGGGEYLVKLDKRLLTKEERLGICETLINQNYIEEAFDMIREYGCEGVSRQRLLKLCSKMILQNLFDENPLLLQMAYEVFETGQCDSVILDYLCEHYNALTDQMYRVLLQGASEHVETYDLEERLVAQMMFSGCTERIDKVFELYMKKKTSDNIVRAYFTIKSSEYFIEDKTPPDKVFDYLEGVVNGSEDKGRIPVIYLLALTKYYSSLGSLYEEQVNLCRMMTGILLEAGFVFPYFKTLSKVVPMPEEIMDKAMIEYHTDKDARVNLEVRILPDEETFHSEDMGRMYQGIFVKQKILFEGEIMEYRISEPDGEEWVLKKEGSVSCDTTSSAKKAGNSRFSCLNEMSLCLTLKDEEGLKNRMREYLEKNAAAEELFPLM